ncbi:MAG TPA: histidine phosphatase family protein [Vicinamibacteria bacterium]
MAPGGAGPTRLHLVRHGQVHNPRRMVYGRLPGWSLSAKGRAQAEAVARVLAGRPVAALYSSPLERARETAHILAAALGLEVRVRDDLTESALAAQWEGLSWPHVWMRRRREWKTYRERPLELAAPEPLDRLARRIADAVREIAAAHRGEEVVAVSHGDPIKAAVLALTGADLARLHDERLPTGGRVTLEVAADGGARVVERDV